MSATSTTLDCRLVNASIACYNIEDGHLQTTSVYYENIKIKTGTKPKVHETGVELITAGFIAELEGDYVLIDLRGTVTKFETDFWKSLLDWLNDFRLGASDWKVGGAVVGEVETGFASAVEDLWPFIKKSLSELDLSNQTILIAGHSKGAAMTYPMATLVNNIYPDAKIEVHCFASPMTANQDFKNYYDGITNITSTIRYQNAKDIVPFLPNYPDILNWILDYVEKLDEKEEKKVLKDLKKEDLQNALNDAIKMTYVRIGELRYLGPKCVIETGEPGEKAAKSAIWDAILGLHFEEIADAHLIKGRYCFCICDGCKCKEK